MALGKCHRKRLQLAGSISESDGECGEQAFPQTQFPPEREDGGFWRQNRLRVCAKTRCDSGTQFRGAVEHGIGEIKADRHGCLDQPNQWAPELDLPFARFLVHKHNYQPRRRQGGQSAAQAQFQRPRIRRTRRERHDIFAWIGARAKYMVRAVDHPNQPDLRRAWRRAVESWLRRQGRIEVSINQQPVIPFSPKMGS